MIFILRCRTAHTAAVSSVKGRIGGSRGLQFGLRKSKTILGRGGICDRMWPCFSKRWTFSARGSLISSCQGIWRHVGLVVTLVVRVSAVLDTYVTVLASCTDCVAMVVCCSKRRRLLDPSDRRLSQRLRWRVDERCVVPVRAFCDWS